MSDKKVLRCILIIFALLFVNLLSFHLIDGQNREINAKKDKLMNLNQVNTCELTSSKMQISVLEEQSPIKIYNNSAFGPSGYNFTGDGSQNQPYRIANYSITSSSTDLIHIENTSVYFIIENCELNSIDNSFTGIYFKNVTNGNILNNHITNNYRGIYLHLSSNNTISENIVTNIINIGIYNFDANYSTINDNFIANISSRGIYLQAHNYATCRYNIVANNTIQQCTTDGIRVGSFVYNTLIINNIISDVGGIGVYIRDRNAYYSIVGNHISNTGSIGINVYWYSSGTNITNNYILNPGGHGISIHSVCDNGQIIGNIIVNAQWEGFSAYNCDGTNLTKNTFINCSSYAIHIYSNSYNTKIKWNTFLDNNGGNNQALDDGVNSIFDYNHWNDHLEPDLNRDGFIDASYSLDYSSADNTDALRLLGVSNSYIRINPVQTFATDALTVELWVKTYNPGYKFFLSYASTNSTNDFLLGSYTSSGLLDIYVGGNATNTGYALVAHEWTHLVVTWQSSDGSTYLWVNGLLEFNGNISKGYIFGTGGSLVFGQDQDSIGGGFVSTQSFDGVLDELRIFNRVLDQTEIQEDYHTKPPYTNRTSAIGWYHFNSDANDSLPNGIGNATTISDVEWVEGVHYNFDQHPRSLPIWINADEDFPNFASTGAGTSENPYIINNQYFISNSSTFIKIINTAAYFKVQNCFFDGLSNVYSAIDVSNSMNGEIKDNQITRCSVGINVTFGKNSSINQNSILNCITGIFFSDCDDPINVTYNEVIECLGDGFRIENSVELNIINNTVLNCGSNGFYLLESEQNSFYDNIVEFNGGNGYRIHKSSNCSFIRNTGNSNHNNGMYIQESTFLEVINNSMFSNYQNGIALRMYCDNNNIKWNLAYLNNESGLILDSFCEYNTLSENFVINNQNSGFELLLSKYNYLTRNKADWNLFGYSLEYSNFNVMFNNSGIKNTGVGIYLENSHYNSFTFNEISENKKGIAFWSGNNNTIDNNLIIRNSNGDGIYLQDSLDNNISNNRIYYNSIYGISLIESSRNNIWANLISRNDNEPQGYDSTGENYWTNGTHGNYWSDHYADDTNGDGVIDTVYNLDGLGNDPYPLLISPSLSTLSLEGFEDEVSIEIGTIELYLLRWLPSTNLIPEHYIIFKDDIPIFESEWVSDEYIEYIVIVSTLTEDRQHNFTLRVLDQSRKVVSHTVFVTVEDTTAPLILSLSPETYEFEGESPNKSINIIYRVTDRDISSFYLYQENYLLASWNWLLRDFGSEDFARDFPECWQATSANVADNIEVSIDSLVMSENSITITSQLTLHLDALFDGIHNFTLTVTDFSDNEASIKFTVTVSGSPFNQTTPGLSGIFALVSLSSLVFVRFKNRRLKYQFKALENRRNI